MKTKTNEYQTLILDAIDEFDLEEFKAETKADYLETRFRAEMQWAIDRAGFLSAAKDWLQGLAVNVPHYNYEILDLAKDAGLISRDASEDEEDNYLNLYWDLHLPVALLQIIFPKVKLGLN